MINDKLYENDSDIFSQLKVIDDKQPPQPRPTQPSISIAVSNNTDNTHYQHIPELKEHQTQDKEDANQVNSRFKDDDNEYESEGNIDGQKEESVQHNIEQVEQQEEQITEQKEREESEHP